MLTYALDSGYLHCHLTKLTALAACHGTRMVYLTSLREMTIIDAVNEQSPRIVFQIEVEPVFVALGPCHCAVGFNNRVWLPELSVCEILW